MRLTEMWLVASPCSFCFSESAAATIAVGSRLAPPTTSAVWPSREMDEAGRGGTTVEMRGSERRIASAFATAERKAGELVVSVDEWTTTIGAELERPPKLRWISAEPAPTETRSPASRRPRALSPPSARRRQAPPRSQPRRSRRPGRGPPPNGPAARSGRRPLGARRAQERQVLRLRPHGSPRLVSIRSRVYTTLQLHSLLS